jgi:hypothetical protein
MGNQGQNLAVDPESADVVIAAVSEGPSQGVSIVQAQFSQVAALFHRLKFGRIGCGGSPKFDGRFNENTT